MLIAGYGKARQIANGSRRVFIYMTAGNLEGEGEGEGERIHPQDQARIDPEGPISLTAVADASFLLIDVPSCQGRGSEQAILQGETA